MWYVSIYINYLKISYELLIHNFLVLARLSIQSHFFKASLLLFFLFIHDPLLFLMLFQKYHSFLIPSQFCLTLSILSVMLLPYDLTDSIRYFALHDRYHWQTEYQIFNSQVKHSNKQCLLEPLFIYATTFLSLLVHFHLISWISVELTLFIKLYAH